MKARVLSIVSGLSVVLFAFCSDDDSGSKTPTNSPATNPDQTQSSPFYGWFKDKTEFSFKTVSVTTGEVAGMQTQNTVTSWFYVSNGKEAVREVSVMELDGEVQPEVEKVFITSDAKNYAINPAQKTYYQETGDRNAVMFSKVWAWTRKRSDSYDALSVNSSAQSSTDVIDNTPVTCYDISGIAFCFDADKKLLRYEGDAGGMHTVITFTDYRDAGVADFIDDHIAAIESDGYTTVSSQFEI